MESGDGVHVKRVKAKFKLSRLLEKERDGKQAPMKHLMSKWLMEGGSTTLRINSLLFLYFSAR